MGAQSTIKVSVELEPGAEPVAGTIQVEDGAPRRFIGWIELTHAIEGARAWRDGAQATEGRRGALSNTIPGVPSEREETS